MSTTSLSNAGNLFDNSSSVFASSSTVNREKLQVKYLSKFAELNCVKRKLLYECHSIFLRSQTITKENQGTLSLNDAMQLSQRYRLAIQSAIVFLEEETDYLAEERQEIGNDLISAQVIWSLFEAVSIRPSDNSIVVDLVEWGRECPFSNTEVLSTVMEDISSWNADQKPETHQYFWNAVFQQVLCCNFKSAAALLQYHSKYESEIPFQRIVRILQSIDMGLSRQRLSSEEFLDTQQEIKALRSSLSQKYHDLKFLCSILLGEQVTFEKCSQAFTMTWFELFPAYVLFSFPAAKAEHIGEIAEKLFAIIEKSKDNLSLLDRILFAILSMDCMEALKLICSAGSTTWWFATHLIDLLYFHDSSILAVSKSLKADAQLSLHTRILIEYANALFRTNGMWEIAADYLTASGSEQALQMLEERVSELDWKGNTRLADRLVSTCDKYDLLSAKGDITRAVTLKLLRDHEWSASLSWALRNGSVDLISQVAQRMLIYSDPDQISQMRIFDAMSESFLIVPELIILYRFYGYKRAVAEGRLRDAVTALHDLFINGAAPDVFFVTLFDEMAQLLQVCSELADDKLAPSLDKQAVLNLIQALAKFEYYYNVRYYAANEVTPERERTNQRIQKSIMTLRPMLISALTTSCLS